MHENKRKLMEKETKRRNIRTSGRKKRKPAAQLQTVGGDPVKANVKKKTHRNTGTECPRTWRTR